MTDTLETIAPHAPADRVETLRARYEVVEAIFGDAVDLEPEYDAGRDEWGAHPIPWGIEEEVIDRWERPAVPAVRSPERRWSVSDQPAPRPRCRFPGCDRPRNAKNGLCAGHEHQRKKHQRLVPIGPRYVKRTDDAPCERCGGTRFQRGPAQGPKCLDCHAERMRAKRRAAS